MKYSKQSKKYKETWLVMAVIALMAYSHDMTYQEMLMKQQKMLVENYWHGE